MGVRVGGGIAEHAERKWNVVRQEHPLVCAALAFLALAAAVLKRCAPTPPSNVGLVDVVEVVFVVFVVFFVIFFFVNSTARSFFWSARDLRTGRIDNVSTPRPIGKTNFPAVLREALVDARHTHTLRVKIPVCTYPACV